MQVEAAGTVFMWEVIIRICLWILESVKKECEVSEEQAKILDGHQKPILLLDKKKTSEILCPSVAPGNPKVGVMLPYAPVQLLIFSFLHFFYKCFTDCIRACLAFEFSHHLTDEESEYFFFTAKKFCERSRVLIHDLL